jgi:CubicO group peptidase (beta-lactamase class C family)
MLAQAYSLTARYLSGIVLKDGVEVFRHQPVYVYDLASLTKVLCTTEVALRFVVDGRLGLDDHHELWHPGVTTRQLLQHTAGYLWWKDLRPAGDRAAILRAALAEPLVTPPGTAHRYSDLGFLALGAALEAVGGKRIDALWADAAGPIAGRLYWGHPDAERTGTQPRGVVNDENARAMDGVAPHAGLFGTVVDVAACAQRWLDGAVPLAGRAFTERGLGSHCLGWDTPSGEQSSAGANPPSDAVGHTGFTGTSIWMSPGKRIVSVLLTNRVLYGEDQSRIRKLRHDWHQLVWDTFG